MPLSIRIIDSPEGENIPQWQCTFPEHGGDIGRAHGVTLQLNDSSSTICERHASIKKMQSHYLIQDESINGLFINGASTPLGKKNQATLNDGDVLTVGEYRLLVSCFVPAFAKADEVDEPKEFLDDPFQKIDTVETIEDKQQNLPKFEQLSSVDLSTQPLLDDDPFLMEIAKETEIKQQNNSFDTSFDTLEEDPFSLNNIMIKRAEQMNEPATVAEKDLPLSTDRFGKVNQYEPLPTDEMELKRMQKKIQKAMDYALSRLLTDLDPLSLEQMFSELVDRNIFSRKPNYWEIYKRYFSRQQRVGDFQMRFNTYFNEYLESKSS